MVFSSAIFVFLFLPVVLIIYYIFPHKFKNIIILFASLIFYSWGEKLIVLVMISSTIIDYSCGILISNGKRRLGLILSIAANLSFLGFFKYFNFTFENLHALIQFIGLDNSLFYNIPKIALPIGISFYTFQSMSYTIDVYNGNVSANKNFIEFATFVTMFPQLVAGPIVRYIDIHKQLKHKNLSIQHFSQGIERFIIGLIKKMLIANTCAYIADDVFTASIGEISSMWAWIGIIAYSFQIYFDFSGYSDMAIGLGKMFGFDFLENFNYPYISKSIREFWRRWHISLSLWFRDYLYIPLGGSRVKQSRVYTNLIIVFFITGLWHGASWNFVVWGLFHGLFIVLERIGFDKILKRLWIPLQHIYTLLIVVVAWGFFRADSLAHSLSYIKKLFSFSNGNLPINSYLVFFHSNAESFIIGTIAIIFSIPVYRKTEELLSKKVKVGTVTSNMVKIIRLLLILSLFIITLSYIAANTYNPFIYYRF
ncbi:MBOAT family protein [candidate division KSB1 bacterium]|nr:MBOAT family protein [candidate division KSB1 bacterium]